ncbi:MAG: glycosyl transferase family 2 [Candidatus Woesearchaeota archaeon]|nr:MAG: glycosyl transferase family 2 [Candidatus Woesearchaeota archaeon]
MDNFPKKYILITAAHNEEEFIEKTIFSVLSQTIKPIEWIIVNDGSTDSTESIVKKYTEEHQFIKLLKRNNSDGYNFSSKVFALKLGLSQIKFNDYKYIGVLDADVSFESNYYESLINELEKDATLGIVGGVYFDIVKNKKVFIKPSPYSIRGATQFFRRKCFEQIGGLQPLKYGGEDALACYTARMYGWKIKNIEHLIVYHLRPTGTKIINIFKTRLRDGFVEYHLGYNCFFQMIKSLSRFNEKPFLIGSLLRIYGFWILFFKGEKRILSTEVIRYIKKEQMKRLLKF